METYLIMMYVSLDQEKAIKKFCLESGWPFCKPDLSYLTDKVGVPRITGLNTGHSNPKLTGSENGCEKDNPATCLAGGNTRDETNKIPDEKKNKDKTVRKSERIKRRRRDKDTKADAKRDANTVNQSEEGNGDDYIEDSIMPDSLVESDSFTEHNPAAEAQEDYEDLVNKIAEQLEQISDNENYGTDNEGNEAGQDRLLNFKCCYCNNSFKYRNKLQQHLRNKHNEIMDITDADVEKFKETRQDRIYRCDYCSVTFKHRANLPRHMRIKHKDILLAQAAENIASQELEINSSHEVNENGTNISIHGVTGSFTEENSAVEMAVDHPDLEEIHQENESENEGNVTEDGGKTDRTSQDILFKCRYCSCTFKCRDNLQQHIRTKHEKINSKVYPCEYCNETFTKIAKIKRHLRVEHNETVVPDKNYVCEICGKIFKMLKSLKEHRDTIHLDTWKRVGQFGRNNICDMCGATFRKQCHLDEHKKKLHGAKKVRFYDCPHCPRKYDKNANLIYHIKKEHEKVKEFQCEKCKKKFYTDKVLRKHIGFCTMKEEDMIPCPKCGKRYKTAYNVQLHMQGEHSKPALECPCGAVIKWKVGVAKHRRHCPLAYKHTNNSENTTINETVKNNNKTSTVQDESGIDETIIADLDEEQIDIPTPIQNMTTVLEASVSQVISQTQQDMTTDLEAPVSQVTSQTTVETEIDKNLTTALEASVSQVISQTQQNMTTDLEAPVSQVISQTTVETELNKNTTTALEASVSQVISQTQQNMTTALQNSVSQVTSETPVDAEIDKAGEDYDKGIGSGQSQSEINKQIFLDLVSNVGEDVLQAALNRPNTSDSNVVYVFMNE